MIRDQEHKSSNWAFPHVPLSPDVHMREGVGMSVYGIICVEKSNEVQVKDKSLFLPLRVTSCRTMTKPFSLFAAYLFMDQRRILFTLTWGL